LARDDGNANGPGQPGDDAEQFSDVRQRLDSLQSRLDAHSPGAADEAKARAGRSGYGLALRISSDFIAAIFVGGALGWGLDQLAGTTPFGMIVLLLLGFAAGVLNVMRATGVVSVPGYAAARRDDTGKNGGQDS
jgi:ATP synthase protein I